jgi:hypothetical protein
MIRDRMSGTRWAVCITLAICASLFSEEEKKQHWWERALVPLDAEVEKALADFAEKTVPYRKKDLEDHIREVNDLAARQFTLPEATHKKLIEAGAKAVDETMKHWVARMTETNRVRLPVTDAETALQTIASWEANTEGIGQNRLVKNFPLPEEQTVWKDTLKSILSADQLKAWEQIQAEALKKREQDAKKYMDPWERRGRERAEKWLASELDEMKKTLALDEARVTVLQKKGAEIIDALAALNVRHVMETLRCATPSRLKQLVAREGTFRAFELELTPESEQEWKDAVSAALKNDEAAKWRSHLAERGKKRETDLKDYVEKVAPQWQPGYEQQMKWHVSAVKAELALDEARAKKLDDAANEAVKVTLETWKTKTAKLLRGLSEEQFQGVITGRNNYYASLEQEDMPANQAVWRKGFQSILSDEERAAWENAQKERTERERRALLLVMVFELDKKLALTAAQRVKLEPVLASVVSDLTKGRTDNGYWSLNLDNLYTTAKRAKSADVRAVLDDVQWRRWETLSAPTRNTRRVTEPGAAKPDEIVAARKPDGYDMEKAISQFLYQRMAEQRTQVAEVMQVKHEDAVRVTGVKDDAAKRLQTAAKGAVEQAMREWRRDMDSYVRGNIQGATPQGIRQRLEGMGNVTFGRRQPAEMFHPWQSTLDTVMDAAQKEAWKKQVDERHEYMRSAMGRFVVSELDRRYRLTKAQHDKLAPMIEALLKEYLPDIEQEFSYYRDSWHLQSYYVLTPLAGIPEKDLKEILNKEQWTQLQERDLPNANSRWNDVKQYHERRMQESKKKEAKK